MIRTLLLTLSLVLTLLTARPSAPPQEEPRKTDAPTDWIELENTDEQKPWKFLSFGGRDAFEIEGNRLSVEMGYPLAGFVYEGSAFPTSNYHLSLQARKVDGTDFFCCLTLPVNDQHCSLVLGGWGGTVTGISCIDKQDASDNPTTSVRKYETGQWYHVEVLVTTDQLVCKLDGQTIVELPLVGIELSLRTEVEPCKPLGLCSFSTAAEWKNIRYRKLK